MTNFGKIESAKSLNAGEPIGGLIFDNEAIVVEICSFNDLFNGGICFFNGCTENDMYVRRTCIHSSDLNTLL